MTTYDRADWHYGGSFPPSQPRENGGSHIGFFLAWVICNGLESELLRTESQNAVAAVRARKVTGTRVLFDECDEKLTDDFLSDEGNAFATDYYGDPKSSPYLEDYARTFGRMETDRYRIRDTWENYDLIAPVITDAYEQWKRRRARPWWRFWGE
jgi:hypothetical protein